MRDFQFINEEASKQKIVEEIDPLYSELGLMDAEGRRKALVMPLFDRGEGCTYFFHLNELSPMDQAKVRPQLLTLIEELARRNLQFKDNELVLSPDGKVHLVDLQGLGLPASGKIEIERIVEFTGLSHQEVSEAVQKGLQRRPGGSTLASMPPEPPGGKMDQALAARKGADPIVHKDEIFPKKEIPGLQVSGLGQDGSESKPLPIGDPFEHLNENRREVTLSMDRDGTFKMGDSPLEFRWFKLVLGPNGRYFLEPEEHGRNLKVDQGKAPRVLGMGQRQPLEEGLVRVEVGGRVYRFQVPSRAPSQAINGGPSLEPVVPFAVDFLGREVRLEPQGNDHFILGKKLEIRRGEDGQWVMIDRRDPETVLTPEDAHRPRHHAGVLKGQALHINGREVKVGQEAVIQSGDSIDALPIFSGKIHFQAPIPIQKVPPVKYQKKVQRSDAPQMLKPPPGKDSFVLGRNPQADVVLEEELASGNHCKIEQGPDGKWYVHDGNPASSPPSDIRKNIGILHPSTNGTYLSGNGGKSFEKLPQFGWVEIREGDLIQIGGIKFNFQPTSKALHQNLQSFVPMPVGDSQPMGAQSPAKVEQPVLVTSNGEMIPLEMLMQNGVLVLGRGGDVQVGGRFEDRDSQVSLRHATLSFHQEMKGGRGVATIRDGASTAHGWKSSLNGTYVNGQKLIPGQSLELKEGDQIYIGDRLFVWKSPQSPVFSKDVIKGTVDHQDFIKKRPEIFQSSQFLTKNFLEGPPAEGLEIPGRNTVYLEGAARFSEGTEGRERIVWNRQEDAVSREFLATVEAEVTSKLQGRILNPRFNPQFESDLKMALQVYMIRLKERFRNPQERPKDAENRLERFADAHTGKKVLVGEFLKEKFPFCRHLAILTQAFLGDLGVEGLRMQRGKAMGGGHVWNEVVINGQKRIIEPTWAFYGNHNEVLAEPNSTLLYSPEMRPAQVK